MEEEKAQKLHDSLQSLRKGAGLGVSSSFNFPGSTKNATPNGLPVNPLYAGFVKEGSWKPLSSSLINGKIKRNFDDCNMDDNHDTKRGKHGDDQKYDNTKPKKLTKEEKMAIKKAAKLEAKKRAKLEEKRRLKLEAKLEAKRLKRSIKSESTEKTKKSPSDGSKQINIPLDKKKDRKSEKKSTKEKKAMKDKLKKKK